MDPFVSVVMPIRNEARFIARSLGSVLDQSYPRDRMEVLIADGMSGDNTREVVEQTVQKKREQLSGVDPATPVRIIDNPSLAVPGGLNKCLSAARGEIIVRIDGHCEIPQDYVRNCVNALATTGAGCVGGSIETIGADFVSRAIAIAQSSRFGVGTVAFRTRHNIGAYVDTVAFGAFRSEVFKKLGGFDEELIRNQDDEFNFRLAHAGYKIWLDPSIHSVYYSRGDFKRLWKQYFQYGFWKVRVMQKHPRQMSWRQFAPPTLVVSLLAGTVLALVNSLFLYLLMLSLGTYLIGIIGASILVGARNGWKYVTLLPVAFSTLHFAYGFGFLLGLWRFRSRWRERNHNDFPMSISDVAPGN